MNERNEFGIDSTAKRGLTRLWGLLAMIPCAPKDFKR